MLTCLAAPCVPRAQLHYLAMWISIENGLEIVADLFNGLAAANAALGSPVSFFIACAVNLFMVVFESIEMILTRRHGGKQTAWDRFFFGQVSHGSSKAVRRELRAHASALTEPTRRAAVRPCAVG